METKQRQVFEVSNDKVTWMESVHNSGVVAAYRYWRWRITSDTPTDGAEGVKPEPAWPKIALSEDSQRMLKDLAPNPTTPTSRPEPRAGLVIDWCGDKWTLRGFCEATKCWRGTDKDGHLGSFTLGMLASANWKPAPSPGVGAGRALAMDFGGQDKAVEVTWTKTSGGEMRVEAVRDLPRDNDGCLCYDCGEEMVYEGRGRYVCEECPSGSGGRQGGKEPASSPAQTRCGLRTRSGIPCDLLPHQHKGRPCQVLPKTKLEEGLMKRQEMSEADIERLARWPR